MPRSGCNKGIDRDKNFLETPFLHYTNTIVETPSVHHMAMPRSGCNKGIDRDKNFLETPLLHSLNKEATPFFARFLTAADMTSARPTNGKRPRPLRGPSADVNGSVSP